jgi:hypothetical protein
LLTEINKQNVMKKSVLLFTLLVLFSTGLVAQEKKIGSAFEIEIDPIAFLLGGYSFHGIYQHEKVRIDAGVYGLDVPESFQHNTGYELRNEGLGIKVNYVLNGVDGWYAGLGLGYSKLEAKHQESGEAATGSSVGTGVDIGYRWFLKKKKDDEVKGLYLTPWLGINYNFYPDKVQFASREYKHKAFELFPTVHLGYRF